MLSHRLAPALASVGLGCGILFTAPFARDVYLGIERHAAGVGPVEESRSARKPLSDGDLVGRVTVARLGLDSPVFEGIGAGTLARGAGHVPKTALPGEEQKSAPSVIAVSRGLRAEAVARLRLGDRVRLITPTGLRRYRVAERRILEPEAFRVGPAATARVALVASYPSDTPGPAPMRLAVFLEQTAE